MTSRATSLRRRIGSSERGFTLIELMISLVLGLLVVAAAGAIFLSNRQTYVATESLGRVQESARTAFELMSRDLRQAGGNPCDVGILTANVLNAPVSRWWSDWGPNVVAYDGATDMAGFPFGAGVGDRVSGTEAVEIKSAHNGVALQSHDAASGTFVLQSADHGLVDGDIVMICDFTQATVLQLGNVSGNTLTYGTGGSVGNCTTGLGLPVACGGGGTTYIYQKNSVIARVDAMRWYIGNNAMGGRSLFREALRAGASLNTEEVANNVTGMTLGYLLPPAADYVDATGVTPVGLASISSIRISLSVEGEEPIGSSGDTIERNMAFVTSLRNRNP